MKLLNLGCGNKYHKDWINIDLNPNNPLVMSHNLLNGLPFSNETIDVIYNSQLLEHFTKENASFFIAECYRVLKVGGIIRIVVPDLENIVNEYLRILNKNINNETLVSSANYDWILLELFDQIKRNSSGGEMLKYLQRDHLINEKYIYSRVGSLLKEVKLSKKQKNNNGFKKFIRLFNFNVFRILLKRIILTKSERKNLEIGNFRNSGEIHYNMYDKYSLQKLLKSKNFNNIKVMSVYNSNIHKWENYSLDVKNGIAIDANSLFIEAVKR